MSTLAGSGCELIVPLHERRPLKEIERSLIKTYRKPLWGQFIRGLKEFSLIEEGDKIGVGISGGKDSLVLAKLLQELKKHGKINFEIEYIAMDPGFHETNRTLLQENCDYLDIPVKIFNSDVFEVVERIASDYPCYMCARMRRGFLYAKAQELGCNKLALAHHFDDIIETTLLNVLYSGNFKTMKPKLKAQNFEGLTLIRPLCYVKEEDIIKFTMNAGISAMNCGCVVAAEKTSSKRREMKELVVELKKKFSDVDKSIFKSAQNVNLDSCLGWQLGGEKYSFLDEFGQE